MFLILITFSTAKKSINQSLLFDLATFLQLLQLIDMEGIDEKLNALYSQVAVSCMSWMLKKDAQLATKFIFMPIMRPLYKISQRDEGLSQQFAKKAVFV